MASLKIVPIEEAKTERRPAVTVTVHRDCMHCGHTFPIGGKACPSCNAEAEPVPEDVLAGLRGMVTSLQRIGTDRAAIERIARPISSQQLAEPQYSHVTRPPQ